MYCGKCGAENLNQSKFCCNCGSLINSSNNFDLNAPKSNCIAANAISFSLALISAIAMAVAWLVDDIYIDERAVISTVSGSVALIAFIMTIVLKKKNKNVDALGWIGFILSCCLLLIAILALINYVRRYK